MNIIIGLDRIALVIAIIAILPGFAIGFQFVDQKFTTVSSDYKKWEREKEKKEEERIEGLRKEWEKEKKEEERALQEEIEAVIKDYPKHLSQFTSWTPRGPIPKGAIRSSIIAQRKTKKPWLYNRYGEPKIKGYYDIPVGEPIINIGESPNMFDHPSVIWCIIMGFLSATVSFFVVLYGLRGMTRGTKWVALWIIEGFRD